MDEPELIKSIAEGTGIVVTDQHQLNRNWLAAQVNELINHNFERLISILYRIDVDEDKLKQMIHNNPGTDAGRIISDLLIERQIQKLKSKQEWSKKQNNIDKNDQW